MPAKKPLTITICSSANFYRQVVDIQAELKKQGYKVIIPATAEHMRAANDYEVSRFKPTVDEFERKAKLMRDHFAEVDKGDAILVVNNEKHGIPNYIGGNVLMEMALAFYQNKPIFLLNKIPDESAFLEEIKGMQPITLNGDMKKLNKILAKLTHIT